ncbi:hypothetical protein C0Q70_04700 [Pomacea canaliculata]|uniref:EGF-like domain-containing protein n=1 Tax=Pomacea canaliculata TaxID=400727 RepID=A0A2T7PJ50_POMCA|nr:hypothetical protein C0Q70_04700 [Pomacea canaliculata]
MDVKEISSVEMLSKESFGSLAAGQRKKGASESLPACKSDSGCGDISNSHCVTLEQPCVCNDGYHETADFTSCSEDIEPGKECLKPGEETECVDNATCTQTTTAGTSDNVSTCVCNEGYHRAQIVNDSIGCEKDLAPGATCTHADNNLECVSNATCRNSSDEAVNSTMKCTCDNGFHEDHSACIPDLLKPGENCTKEGSSDECSDNAVCVKTVEDGGAEQLQCQCNNDYHNTTDSSGNAVCEMDTCDDSLMKCNATGFSTCTEVNTQVTCILSSRCNSSITLDVEKYWLALSAARGHMTNCNYTAGNSCKEEITACFNVFLKTETSCSSLDILTTCLNQTTCNASKQEEAMLSLAFTASSNAAEEISCKCVSGVDRCLTEYNSSTENIMEQAQLCTSVKALLDCVFEADCHPERSVDHQKLSQAWSLALDRAKTNHCSLTAEEAKSCALQATRCSLLYASGIQNATSKDQQCRSVAELKQCLDLNTTACRQEDLVVFRDQQKAAVDSFNCGCLMTLDTCDTKYSQQIQNSSQDATRKCLAVSTYLSCILQGSCSLSDPVDSTRLSLAQTMANGQRDSNNCKISQTADGSCDGDIVFCSNEYNSALNAQSTEASKKCESVLRLTYSAGERKVVGACIPQPGAVSERRQVPRERGESTRHLQSGCRLQAAVP